MTPDGSLIASSPADALLSRLEEPQVAAAINDLLDHADVLAVMVVAIDGFVRRGAAIADAFTEALGELRGALPGSQQPYRADPKAIDIITQVTRALVAGAEAAKTEPMKLSGFFSLLHMLKDDDVARGLGFLLQVVRAFGRELKDA